MLRAFYALVVILLIGLVGLTGMALSSTSSQLDKTKKQLNAQQQVADYSAIYYAAMYHLNNVMNEFEYDYSVKGDQAEAKADLVRWQQTLSDVARQVQAARVPSALAAADQQLKGGVQTMTTAVTRMQDGVNRNDRAAFAEGGDLLAQSGDQLDKAGSLITAVLSP